MDFDEILYAGTCRVHRCRTMLKIHLM